MPTPRCDGSLLTPSPSRPSPRSTARVSSHRGPYAAETLPLAPQHTRDVLSLPYDLPLSPAPLRGPPIQADPHAAHPAYPPVHYHQHDHPQRYAAPGPQPGYEAQAWGGVTSNHMGGPVGPWGANGDDAPIAPAPASAAFHGNAGAQGSGDARVGHEAAVRALPKEEGEGGQDQGSVVAAVADAAANGEPREAIQAPSLAATWPAAHGAPRPRPRASLEANGPRANGSAGGDAGADANYGARNSAGTADADVDSNVGVRFFDEGREVTSTGDPALHVGPPTALPPHGPSAAALSEQSVSRRPSRALPDPAPATSAPAATATATTTATAVSRGAVVSTFSPARRAPPTPPPSAASAAAPAPPSSTFAVAVSASGSPGATPMRMAAPGTERRPRASSQGPEGSSSRGADSVVSRNADGSPRNPDSEGLSRDSLAALMRLASPEAVDGELMDKGDRAMGDKTGGGRVGREGGTTGGGRADGAGVEGRMPDGDDASGARVNGADVRKADGMLDERGARGVALAAGDDGRVSGEGRVSVRAESTASQPGPGSEAGSAAGSDGRGGAVAGRGWWWRPRVRPGLGRGTLSARWSGRGRRSGSMSTWPRLSRRSG